MQKPYLVGIAGGSASGKTYLLKSLMNHFNMSDICLISQDHYYKSINHQLVDENGQVNFDLPEGIERELLFKDISDLLSGNCIYKQEYTFNIKKDKPEILCIEPAPIIVIEGLFIFHFTELFELFDYKVFVDADHDIKLNRRLTRDQVERGYTQDMILYQWYNHVMPAYDEYLLPYKTKCEFVIHNNDDISNEINQLSNYLKQRLV
jgi:uridine kinase